MAAEKKSKKTVTQTSFDYHKIVISCACGATYDSGSTRSAIRVDICAGCHPFFTGEKRILDAEGRVEKFRKKYNLPTT
ncbi:MAG: 50S ribosomal protein L31 [Candidatus Margulisbacteria bacterium]|nr:50S ribosomal protein L31 [Candidatus Margulisiibacteriota bacterium]